MTDAIPNIPNIPAEIAPQPVPDHPGWVWWRGVGGLVYARRPGTSPPQVARAHNFAALLAAIRKREGRAVDIDLADLAAEFPSWDIGRMGHSELPAGWDLTGRRDGVLLIAATAAALREKIRREERPT